MRPKDFPFKYTWENRVPFMNRGVLFVPNYYFAHNKWQMPDFRNIFQNDRDVKVEFCSGNGEWIIEKAKENSLTNWIAVDCKLSRIQKIWSKRENLTLTNLLIVNGRAEEFSKYYLNENSISGIHINFPDPWRKRRDAKKRLLTSDFSEILYKKSKMGSTIELVTDSIPYMESAIENLKYHWNPIRGSPYYEEFDSSYGMSYFTRKFIEEGKQIYRTKFAKGSG